MSIRLLGGFAKNFEVKNDKTSNLKPTLSQLKRKVFDRFQNMNNYHFIDLCAGTGSIGFEALSRGANYVSLIEKSKKNYLNLLKNIKSFEKKFSNDNKFQISSFNISFQKYLTEFKEEKWDKIYYFDPPFNEVELYADFFKLIPKMNGIVLIEGDTQKTFSIDEMLSKCESSGLSEIKTYKSSSHYIIYLEN